MEPRTTRVYDAGAAEEERVIWRVWSLLAGAPFGALAAQGLAAPDAPVVALLLGTIGGALSTGVAAHLLAGWFADEPARGAHLASAASAGLAAFPAHASAALGLGPDPRWWLAVVAVALALAFARAARLHRPSGGLPRQLRVAALWLGGGALLCVGTGLARGAASGEGPVFDALPAAVWGEAGAGPTASPPIVCNGIAKVEERLDRGARPRLDPRGESLWFDAAVAGRRQLYRLRLASGEVACRTCGEPGDNVRPWPGSDGVVFETSRHRTWQSPLNTELRWLHGDREGERSQRLTFGTGPDDHAILLPGGERLLWSQRRGRGYEVVAARLRSSGRSRRLEREAVIARGGASWLAPVARADRPSLALASGNPFAPRTGVRMDLADATTTPLGDDLSPGGVAFSRDGDVVALAASRRARVAGLLPEALGAALAPIAVRLEWRGALMRETWLRSESGSGAPSALEAPLAAFTRWGAATGIALSPDGRTLFLAQRNAEGAERVLEIGLRCE